jgi:sterol desaturase/sphingolipid hydroxylase (fatty acid hydroxylase superfamily)
MWVFWMPLAFLGFEPRLILQQQAISLFYQFWIHTRLVGRLGPLEWVFNTPSHHRVHHGVNLPYLDRNYAGILIVWDRLFGTFTPETEEARYGVLKPPGSFNLLTIAFHTWRDLARDVWRAPTLAAKLGYVFRAPGWRHDGTGMTVARMRSGGGR